MSTTTSARRNPTFLQQQPAKNASAFCPRMVLHRLAPIHRFFFKALRRCTLLDSQGRISGGWRRSTTTPHTHSCPSAGPSAALQLRSSPVPTAATIAIVSNDAACPGPPPAPFPLRFSSGRRGAPRRATLTSPVFQPPPLRSSSTLTRPRRHTAGKLPYRLEPSPNAVIDHRLLAPSSPSSSSVPSSSLLASSPATAASVPSTAFSAPAAAP